MSPEERRLCIELIITPPSGARGIPKAEFIRRFPAAVERGSVATRLLEEAYEKRDDEEVQCALVVGHAFGFAPSQADVLIRLLDADWHLSHEDLVSALDRLNTPEAVDSLYRATQWVPEYLSFDESRALAVKAIWALGKISSSDATAALRRLAATDHAVLRDAAKYQLELRP